MDAPSPPPDPPFDHEDDDDPGVPPLPLPPRPAAPAPGLDVRREWIVLVVAGAVTVAIVAFMADIALVLAGSRGLLHIIGESHGGEL